MRSRWKLISMVCAICLKQLLQLRLENEPYYGVRVMHRLADLFNNKQKNTVFYELMPLNTDISYTLIFKTSDN